MANKKNPYAGTQTEKNLEAAEKQKKPIIPTCSYVAKLLAK